VKKEVGLTLLELMVVMAIIAILIAFSLPSLRLAREKARSVACLSGLRQLAMGTMLYSDSNDGLLPYPNASFSGSGANPELCWFNAYDPYLLGLAVATNKASEHLHLVKQDPIFQKFNPVWKQDVHTIKMNAWLREDRYGNKRFWGLNELGNSGKTVLFFDGKAEFSKLASGLPNLQAKRTDGTEGDVMRRHANRANVLFADGHVELRAEKNQLDGDRLGWDVNNTSLVWKPWLSP